MQMALTKIWIAMEVAFFISLCHTGTNAFSFRTINNIGRRRCQQQRKGVSDSSSTLSSFDSSLASSFVDGVNLQTIQVPRESPDGQEQYYRLAYRFVGRHTRKPPVVVLHGGPSLPSSYLYNLADLGFRSMLFYDQLGCGSSDEPTEPYNYSVRLAVEDLDLLIETVLGPTTPYHLYGHSYGGALAYHFLRTAETTTGKNCRSVTLSSAPTSIPQVRSDYERLVKEKGPTRFAKEHVCRLQPVPAVLAAAYQYPGRVWTGLSAWQDYVAPPTTSLLRYPCLALSGEHDFVTNAVDWKQYFASCRVGNLPGCSHHGLYENPSLYAETLRDFWTENDY
jgi:L-proline amide hydrolase